MKKIAFLILVMLVGITGANAKTKTTVTELTINTENGIISSTQFSSASVGDVITFSHETTGGTHFKLFYKIGESDSWAYHKFSGVSYNSNGETDYYTPWINYGNSYTITIVSADLTSMQSYGIWLEDYTTITSVNLTHTETLEETGTTNIYTGSHDLASWQGLALTTGYLDGKLANAKIGDVLQVTYSATEAGVINFCNSGYTNFEAENHNVSAASTVTEFEITTASILESIQNNGLVLNGEKAVISSVDLLTYSDSYDAVGVTIGEDEIATFSSTKKLDFSGTGITAYFASAYTEEGVITLTPATDNKTWDYCGYILVGDAGTYTVPVASGSGFYPSATWLQGNPGANSIPATVSREINEESTTYYNYIFAKVTEGDASTIGFYKLSAAHDLAAKKAYLSIPADISVAGAPMVRLVFEEENGATDLNASMEQTNDCVKVIRNGKLLIIKNGIAYDALGNVIR